MLPQARFRGYHPLLHIIVYPHPSAQACLASARLGVHLLKAIRLAFLRANTKEKLRQTFGVSFPLLRPRSLRPARHSERRSKKAELNDEPRLEHRDTESIDSRSWPLAPCGQHFLSIVSVGRVA